MSEEGLSLNDDWIINFEKTDKLYEDFYKDDVCYTNITFMYINKDSEIEKISEESFLLSKPNFILREELIGILKKTLQDNERKYKLFSILKYNITLSPENVQNYLFNQNDNYLTIIKNIDTIFFEKTINLFQDLNDIIFIFCEKTSSNNDTTQNHSKTKKIYINNTYFNNKKYTRKVINYSNFVSSNNINAIAE